MAEHRKPFDRKSDSTPGPIDNGDLHDEVTSVTSLPPRAGKEISSMLIDTVEGQLGLSDLLHIPCLYDSGQLTSNTERGSFLAVFHVAPTALEKSMISRVAYLSRLFTYWRGDLRFEIVITKSKFQELKLLLVFVPGATLPEVKAMTVEELTSYQTSSVVGTSTDKVLKLDVPFIHESMWARTNKSTGVFAVVLFDRMISVMDVDSPISWSLFVSSPKGRDQLRFRNAVPPPRRVKPNGEGPSTPGSRADLKISAGDVYAAGSTSQRSRQPALRAPIIHLPDHVGYRPNGGYPSKLEFAVPVDFAGKDLNLIGRKLMRLGLSPPSSFVTGTGTLYKSLVPYLPVINSVPAEGFKDKASLTANVWIQGVSPPTPITGGHSMVPLGTAKDGMFFNFTMDPIDAARFDGWKVICSFYWAGHTRMCEMRFSYDNVSSGRAICTLKAIGRVHETDSVNAAPIFAEPGSPIFFMDSPTSVVGYDSSAIADWFATQMRLAQMRQQASFFYLYVGGNSKTISQLQNWLTNGVDSSVPQEALGLVCSLSLSDPKAFVEIGQQLTNETREIIMWLFNLFGGNSESRIGQIVRYADIIFDLLIPLVVAYDGMPSVQNVEDLKFVQVLDDAPVERTGVFQVAEAPRLKTWHFKLPVAEERSKVQRVKDHIAARHEEHVTERAAKAAEKQVAQMAP
nr:MAG: capsid protein [Wufeng shrew picorna-like virus 54]